MDKVRADAIAKLKHHPAFKDLAAEVAEAEQRYWRNVVARLKAGEAIDQRELDEARGHFKAADLFVKYPDKALRMLERAKENDPIEE